MNLQSRPERRIVRRRIVHIVLFSSLITLVTTSIQLYREYRQDLEILDREVEQIRISYTDSLQATLWIMNQDQVQIIIDGISRLWDVLQVTVEMDGELLFSAGIADDRATIVHSFELLHNYGGRQVPLGTLRVVFDLQALYDRLIARVGVILLSNAVKTFAVAIFIFFLFQHLVTRHLERISGYARTLSPENLDQPLELQRRSNDKPSDELEQFAESINNMRETLRDSYETLSKSEERFRQLAENIDAVFWIESPDGSQVLYVSPAFERIWGQPGHRLYKDRDFWLQSVHADGRAALREAFEQATRRTGEHSRELWRPVQFPEYRIVRDDGSVRWIQSHAFPVTDASGQVLRVVGLAQDVTERVQAVQSLEQSETAAINARRHLFDAIESVPVSFELYDAEDRLVLTNSKAKEFFPELTPLQKPGTSFEEVARFAAQNHLVVARLDEGERRAVGADAKTWVSERMRLHRNPKSPFDFEWAGGKWFRLLERKTSDGGTVVACIDITDRRQIERQLAQAQRMEAIGQLTGGVAHDFNNLLTLVLGNLELLEEQLRSDKEKASLVHKVIAASERGASLTQRLLAVARKQPLQPQNVDIAKLVHGLLDLLRRTLGETVEIEVVADAGLWTCTVDPGQLENALLNLAINARDAMPEGGKLTIEASNARLDEDYADAEVELTTGQYVLLAVTDTGGGMPREVQEQAFEPFFTTKATGQGTGLGLSMVYGFVKQTGGHVKICSELGEGTTVKIYLPRYRGSEPVEAPSREDADVLEMGDALVLVVEDDEDLRSLLGDMLRSLGYRVMDADAGQSALDLLEREPGIQLLLTDVVLPGGMSGRELAEQTHRRLPDLPVLYMSGYTENAITHHGRLDDGVQLLQKPFRKSGVSRAIRRALDQRSDAN